MKKIIIFLFLVVMIGAGAYGVNRMNRKDGVLVTVEPVRKRDRFQSYVTASGEIVASRYADIGSSIMGRLVDLRVKEGDTVKRGQVVAVVDPVQAQSDVTAQEAQIRTLEAEERMASEQVRSARAELSVSQARQREAAANLARISKLIEAGVTPVAQMDTATANAEATKAQVAAAETAIARSEKSLEAAQRRIAQAQALSVRVQDVLSKTRITAPMDGLVSRLQVREGEMVVMGIQNQPGTTLMTISDLSSINAEVKVAEADVVQVRVGQPARVTLEAIPGKDFQGKVVEVGSSALPVVGTGAAAREFKVVVKLEQPDSVLRPGLTSDAEVLVNEKPGAVTAPLQAVVLRSTPEGGEATGVFVVRAGRAAFVPVKTGIIGGLDIEVIGVDADTPVIVGPVQALRDLKDGDMVRTQ